MSKPAARIGDTLIDTVVVHEDVIAEGSGNVFVNGIPKARLGDMTTGHTPPGHNNFPPVPIVEGSGSVFVNGRPAARLGDKSASHTEAPHDPDQQHPHDAVINTGSGNVFVG